MAAQQPAKQPAEALAEEDEFEEFDLEGSRLSDTIRRACRASACSARPPSAPADWNPKQEDPADAQLWEQVRSSSAPDHTPDQLCLWRQRLSL